MSGHPLLRPGPLPGVSIAWVDLDRPPEPLARLEGWLDAGERERAARFRFEIDRRRYVSARGMLRSLLGGWLGLEPSEVPIAADRFGKPRLAARAGIDLQFNVSHAAGRALFGLVSGHEIGVDTENVRRIADMDALARSVFARSELEAWRSVPPESRVESFFAGWTRKEAFVKALGRGLGFPLQAFEVALTPGRPPRLLRVAPEEGPTSRWSMAAWSPEAGFVAALVTDRASALPGESRAGAAGESPRDPRDP